MDVLQNSTIGLTGIGFKATKDELVACYQTAIKSPEKKRYLPLSAITVIISFWIFYSALGL